ncbi:hypothetical protein D3C71_1388480 [compost metagenome]
MEVEPARSLGHDLTRGQAVDLLLQDHAGEDGDHPDGFLARELLHHVHDAGVFQHQIALEVADVGHGLGLFLLALARDQDAVTALVVDIDGGLLVGAEQAEGGEEHVQQTRVIGVLDVLLHLLPVGRNVLTVVAQHLQLPAVIDAGVVLPELLAEVLAEGRRLVREGGPDHAVDHLDAQLVQAVVLGVEVRRHAALTLDAATEGHALQVAVQRIGPLVIGADQLLGVAGAGLAELDALVGAAVLDDRDLVLARTDHDAGFLAQGRRLPVADLGQLALQTDIEPVRSVPDLLQFLGVDRGVRIDPVGHGGVDVGRPRAAVLALRRAYGDVH